MKTLLHIYTRLEWRQWLEQNFRSEKEAWLVFPAKSTGKAGILYNDAVEGRCRTYRAALFSPQAYKQLLSAQQRAVTVVGRK